mmetsp:Transcript_45408/g.114291  ORF Transcript_45408/g.114291 Transcript_45408/m.114291 type:complete len:276 (-) Transcript_45408:1012-1839(-)
MSPSERDTARLLSTRYTPRPQLYTVPPDAWMRSFSSSRYGLWSTDRRTASPDRDITARESPTLPHTSWLLTSATVTAVVPSCSGPERASFFHSSSTCRYDASMHFFTMAPSSTPCGVKSSWQNRCPDSSSSANSAHLAPPCPSYTAANRIGACSILHCGRFMPLSQGGRGSCVMGDLYFVWGSSTSSTSSSCPRLSCSSGVDCTAHAARRSPPVPLWPEACTPTSSTSSSCVPSFSTSCACCFCMRARRRAAAAVSAGTKRSRLTSRITSYRSSW